MSKKFKYISQLIGAIYILLSFYFVSNASNDPTPVDEFNIYWMFTLSAMSLGGFLVVTNSQNKLIHFGTRGILIVSVLFPVYLVFTRDLGAAFYFPWAFIILALFTLLKPQLLDHKKSVIFISRIFVGSLFIVSGLIKANDPLGFSYKLEEYFTDTALGSSSLGPDFWTFFYDWSLFLSIFISAIEVLLGIAVLIGGKARLVTWTLLSMAIFFAWLTWFTANCLEERTAFSDKNQKETIKIDEEFKPQIEKLSKDYEGYYEYIGDSDDNFSPEELVIINEIRGKVAIIDSLKNKKIHDLGEFKPTCVDDCGCFGDAMKGSVGRSLTPWESFYKDICLLFFVIILLLYSGEIKLNTIKEDLSIIPISMLLVALFSGGLFDWMFPFYFTFAAVLMYWLIKKYPIKKLGAEWTIAIVMFLLSLGFTLYCLWYLPIKDFRPYAIGNNLIEQRTSIQPELKFYYTLKDKKSGEKKEFDHWPENWDQNYDYVSSRNVVIKEGVDAPAKDFSITDIATGTDITDSVLLMENVFIMVAYDLKHADIDAMNKATEIAAAAKKDGVTFICLTASGAKIQDSVIKELKPSFKFYSADEKVQKTIIRSNPGLLFIQKAVVKNMWPAISFPDYEEIKNEYIK
jgi:uncharacterized membrane protein YphA (DoxX/SURF4 family)